MFCHALIELRTDGADRTEGAACVLKDHAELRTVELSELTGGEIRQVFALVPDIAPGDEAGFTKQAHGRFDQCGLAGARFANNAKDLPIVYREAHVLDDFNAVIGNIDVIVT